MDIGEVKKTLLEGKKVAREGWNGKGMYLKYLTPGYFSDEAQAKSLGLTMAETPTMLGFVVIKTAQNAWIPWLCSQADFLANDWEIVG